MNWYKLQKFAGAQEKIAKYKIVNPYDQAYVYKYEKVMPWDTIRDAKDLRLYMIQQLKELHQRKNKLENEKSIEVIDNWVQLLSSWTSDPYKTSSRTMLLLEPLIKWAEGHKAEPQIAMPDAAEKVLEMIKSNPKASINFLREYRKLATPIPRENGWHLFENGSNPQDLYFFTQGGGWCLSTTQYSEGYLSENDVWIYVDNEEPVVAMTIGDIEMEDDDGDTNFIENVVKEIRGVSNSVPVQYGLEIAEKVEEEEWDTDYSEHYENAVVPAILNRDLEANPDNEEVLSRYKNRLFYENEAWDNLTPALKQNPKIRQITEQHLVERLTGKISRFNGLSQEMKKDFEDLLIKCVLTAIQNNNIEGLHPENMTQRMREQIDWEALTKITIDRIETGSKNIFNMPQFVWEYMTDAEVTSLILRRNVGYTINLSGLFISKTLGEERTNNIQRLLNEIFYQNLLRQLNSGTTIYTMFVNFLDQDKIPELRQKFVNNNKEALLGTIKISIANMVNSGFRNESIYTPKELEEETKQVAKDMVKTLSEVRQTILKTLVYILV